VAKDLGEHVGEQTQIAGRADRRADFVRAEEKIRRADLGLATEYLAPRNEVERKLSAIWQEVFGIDVVGVSDDFFELGGDSLTATTLAAEIEATFGVRFAPSDIIRLSTIRQQAELFAKTSGAARQLPACLILGATGGPKPPLFMVHGGKGFAFFRPAFLEIVGEERPIYLFQAPGLDGRTPLKSVEEAITVEQIAVVYAEAIRSVQPAGPYHIAAICAGSFIAVEMCKHLERAGQSIGRLILLDPTPMPPRSKTSPIKEKLKKQRAKKASKLKLGARILGFFAGEEKTGGSTEDLDPAEMPQKKIEIHRDMIERRVGEIENVPQNERSYTAERIFKISLQFRAALYNHVPRPYSGRAALLVSSSRAQETLADTAFWPNNLGSMQYKVLGADHSDVFNENLEETARFVRDTLD
jgi:thioesterase domain-containing protein/acyl carrier protein